MTECGGVILVVDDEPDNIELISAALEDQHHVIFATHGEEAIVLAHSQRPDLILLDVMMPAPGGYEVCARLKADPATKAIPVIFVTGLDSQEDEAKGLDLGAIDYVTKPVSPPILCARVRNHLELKRARDQLEILSSSDALTGLANRRRFDTVVAAEIARHRRNDEPLSLVLIDVDHFKAYNDIYGHVPGDACLRRVAETIAAAVRRPPDLVARYGGEEFVCILPETDHHGAMRVAEQIRAAVNALRIPHERSSAANHVTVSIGVITTRCDDSLGPNELVALADGQLYGAKSEGRNTIQCFDATADEAAAALE